MKWKPCAYVWRKQEEIEEESLIRNWKEIYQTATNRVLFFSSLPMPIPLLFVVMTETAVVDYSCRDVCSALWNSQCFCANTFVCVCVCVCMWALAQFHINILVIGTYFLLRKILANHWHFELLLLGLYLLGHTGCKKKEDLFLRSFIKEWFTALATWITTICKYTTVIVGGTRKKGPTSPPPLHLKPCKFQEPRLYVLGWSEPLFYWLLQKKCIPSMHTNRIACT